MKYNVDVLLQVIARLRKLICPETDIDEIDIDESEDEISSDEEDSSESPQDSFVEWQCPYHKDMKCPSLKTGKLGKSKYDRVFGPYSYDKEPERNLASRKVKGKTSPAKSTEILAERGDQNQFMSYDASHVCPNCSVTVRHKITRINILNTNTRVLVPGGARYEEVRRKLKGQGETPRKKQTQHSTTDLKSWIFTPTHDRILKGSLNLTHNMVDPDSKEDIFKSYVHVLVVRSGEFEQ